MVFPAHIDILTQMGSPMGGGNNSRSLNRAIRPNRYLGANGQFKGAAKITLWPPWVLNRVSHVKAISWAREMVKGRRKSLAGSKLGISCLKRYLGNMRIVRGRQN